MRKWFWMIFLMGRQKSGISMLSLQRMLIPSYKAIWIMGREIRKAMADRDVYYMLAGLIEAAEALPCVHTLIANTKGNICGVCHGGLSRKHLDRYLAEFCHRFNCRFSESHMFGRILAAYAATNTICYSKLRAEANKVLLNGNPL